MPGMVEPFLLDYLRLPELAKNSLKCYDNDWFIKKSKKEKTEIKLGLMKWIYKLFKLTRRV